MTAIVHVFTCPGCDESWSIVGERDPRSTCRKCGSSLEVEEVKVAR